jgi:hypothetical protein
MEQHSCEHVADDPEKIMAATLQPYIEPTANISTAPLKPKANIQQPSSKPLPHQHSATFLQQHLLNHPQQLSQQNQPTTTTFSPIKTKTSQHQRGKKKPQKPTIRA